MAINCHSCFCSFELAIHPKYRVFNQSYLMYFRCIGATMTEMIADPLSLFLNFCYIMWFFLDSVQNFRNCAKTVLSDRANIEFVDLQSNSSSCHVKLFCEHFGICTVVLKGFPAKTFQKFTLIKSISHFSRIRYFHTSISSHLGLELTRFK